MTRRPRDRSEKRSHPRKPSRGGTRARESSTRREERPEQVHVSDDVAAELRATARPGKGDILVKVFADAASAFVEGDYAEAIKLGEQAKHIALRSIAARELLGLAYYRAGKWNEAARELAAFRRLSGSTEQNPVIADCYRALGKPEKAVDVVAEIHRRNVDESVVYEGAIVAAGALADLDRIDDAIAQLERLELRPENAQDHHLRAWYFLGDLLERKGRFTQAREWFDAVATADPELTDATDRARKLGH